MTERLLGRGKTSGRADDNIDTIKLRLDTFHKHSKPVVEAYKAKCCTVSISFLNELLPIYNVKLSLMLQNCKFYVYFTFADSSRTRPKRHFCRCVCRSRQIVIRRCTWKSRCHCLFIKTNDANISFCLPNSRKIHF